MIDALKQKLKSLALADAILSPEWEYRYFSYDSHWSDNEEMASMRDGSGGHWFVLFQHERVGYKFISPDDGLMDNLSEIKEKIPEYYRGFMNESAFYPDQATGIWLLENNEWIKYGLPTAEYLEDLDTILKWGHEGYKKWAQDYYERDIDDEALSSVFEQKIDSTILARLNPNITIKELENDLSEIGIKSYRDRTPHH